MMISNDCVTVDLDGLRKQLARKGPAFVVWELLQNALDADGCTEVRVYLSPIAGRPAAVLEVEDNSPVGFRDLSHAWTLFAPSEKKGDPTKRGFMNLGEKLALSMCESARITTTTGGVRFDSDGRHLLRTKRQFGTLVRMVLRLTHAECKQIEADIRAQVICPEGVCLTVNGQTIGRPEMVSSYDQELPTRIADDEGYIRPTRRKTGVQLYAINPGDQARLYEMGIPVVDIECAWHVDVGQKVPLNSDRDNVTPAYLKEVLVGVLNHTAHLVTKDEAPRSWVATALESPNVEPGAVQRILETQYGEKRVIADPSDPEGTKIAVTKGYTVIPGPAFSKEAWKNIRESGAVLPAGQVTPSPKPFGPDGEPLNYLDEFEPEHRTRISFVHTLAKFLLGQDIMVRITDTPSWGFSATYSSRRGMIINQGAVGFFWFQLPHYHAQVMDLLIHELAHHNVSDHLSEDYHKECTRLAGLAVQYAIEAPSKFSTPTV